MLVSIIILILAASSTPLFRKTYEDIKLDSYAKDMYRLIEFCRERAIFERTRYSLVIENEKNTYSIYVREDENGEPRPASGRWGHTLTAPKGVDITSDKKEIYFFPDGYTDSAIINIKGKGNRQQVIRLDGTSGAVKIYDDIR
jgi:Tfp pilus assembly protein FimT